MTTNKCGNCKLYDYKKHINNCKALVVATTHPNDMGCYQIQFNKINKDKEYENISRNN